MKTFEEFVLDRKLCETAGLIATLGLNSELFCESVLHQIKMAKRYHLPLKEAFMNEAWWNPMSWGKKGNDGGGEAPQTPADKLAQRDGSQTWANTGRRFMGGVKGVGNAMAGLVNGQGMSGQVGTGKSMATLQGAIKDLQNLKANINADQDLAGEINAMEVGPGLPFQKVLNVMFMVLTNKLQEITNLQQGGKKKMGLRGVTQSGPGNAAAPFAGAGLNPAAPDATAAA